VTETSVEDIKSLVKQERAIEEELQRAKEEAASIVEEAKAEAKRILEEVEDGRYYSSLFETEVRKIDEKKKAVEKEWDDAVEELNRTASENMEKAVGLVVKLVLEE
jgi:vacuolar-type H+-ATPase subunit H